MIPVLSGTAPAGVRVLIATRPVDFRRGADGLAATVQSVLRHDPFCGTVFVFRSKRADRISRINLAYEPNPAPRRQIGIRPNHSQKGGFSRKRPAELAPAISLRGFPEWRLCGFRRPRRRCAGPGLLSQVRRAKASSQLRPSKNRRGRIWTGSKSSRQRALTLKFSGSERGT
jgi:IS66 Orf2 like protein